MKRLTAALLVLSLALTATACAGETDESATTADGTGTTAEDDAGDEPAEPAADGDTAAAAAAAGEAFPATFAHRHGETELAERPERIVTVGLTDHDAFLALGVVPSSTR